MSYGFVYILANEYMPDVIKVGCTERSPVARAEELSRPTGVPVPFQVLCYAEFADFQTVERNMHHWLRDHRISTNREFFHGCEAYAVSLLFFHPGRLAFTDATAAYGFAGDSELVARNCRGPLHAYFDDLRNPFHSQEKNDERQAAKARVLAEIEASDEPELIVDLVPALDPPTAANEPNKKEAA